MIKDEFSKSLVRALETPDIREKARILSIVPVYLAATKILWHDGLYWIIHEKENRN